MSTKARIPVVMFHSVNAPDSGWIWDELTSSVADFERKLNCLIEWGYRSVNLDEFHDVQASGTCTTERRVVLTFDDGYLDNWVYVYPLLKRAGWRGTVYINPEFVDHGTACRPSLEDVWAGRYTMSDLVTTGFLNWAEIEEMDRSGVLDIASHSMSHTWYPTGSEILDFHRPGLETPWLAWNARPDRKPYYRLEDQTGFVPWGTPIHRNGRSLGIRRFFPDPAVGESVIAKVSRSGGEEFFARASWRTELLAAAAAADAGGGRFETDEEMNARFKYEIDEANRILAERLGHEVRHFCWPGGAYCDASWDLVTKRGFRTFTVKRSDLARWSTEDPRLARRISEYRHFSFLGRRFASDDPSLLPAACDVELGRRGAALNLRLRKGLAALRSGGSR